MLNYSYLGWMMLTTDFWSPVLLSLLIASISLVFVLISACLAAKKLYRTNFKWKITLETILILPLVLPPTVVGFLLIMIFGNQSLIGETLQNVFKQSIMFTPLAAIIASTVVAFPLMYQSCKTGFLSVPLEVEEAARVDGATERQVFRWITLPLSSRALVSGSILAFARALGEFGATLMFAGNIPGKTQTIPTAIYVAFESGQTDLAWRWVVVIIFLSWVMLYVSSRIKE